MVPKCIFTIHTTKRKGGNISALGARCASFQAEMPLTHTFLSNQGLCSLQCIPTTVPWIPEEAGLCSHFDTPLLWGNQDSSGYVATFDCVSSSFQCY